MLKVKRDYIKLNIAIKNKGGRYGTRHPTLAMTRSRSHKALSHEPIKRTTLKNRKEERTAKP